MVWRAFVLIQFIVNVVIFYFKIKSTRRAAFFPVIITHSFDRKLSQKGKPLLQLFDTKHTLQQVDSLSKCSEYFLLFATKCICFEIWNVFSIVIYFPRFFFSPIPVLYSAWGIWENERLSIWQGFIGWVQYWWIGFLHCLYFVFIFFLLNIHLLKTNATFGSVALIAMIELPDRYP